MITRLSHLAIALTLTATLVACETVPPLRAKRIVKEDELIGGPGAKGKLGDYLLENDQIRAIVGGPGPGWAAGVFGGTLLDLDRHRWESAYRGGKGWDALAETFPLANLLVANPADPMQVLELKADSTSITTTPGSVRVLKDGSDGEAIVRVEGHAGYMFDVMKYLNRGALDGVLGNLNLEFGGMQLGLDQIVDLVDAMLGVNLFAVLNRLQLNFDFTTDYILHAGDSYVTLRTTVVAAPPTKEMLGGCAPVPCDLKCENGFAMRETDEAVSTRAAPFKRVCPVCECAKRVDDMPTFNESRDFFPVLLGSPEGWADPTWKGGVVAGDFLFYGGNVSAFAPGLGFDIDRRLYEDMWQEVGTFGAPFVLDFMAGTAENVSYSWVTRNPNQKDGFDCPSYRVVVTGLDTAKQTEDDFSAKLADGFGIAKGDAAARARQLVVSHKAIPLADVPMDGKDPGKDSPDRAAAFEAWAAAALDGAEAQAVAAKLGDGVTLALVPRHDCMPSKVMIPLYSTSATAVLTHFSEGDAQDDEGDGSVVDRTRGYTFERYIVVGDGDVGSTLRTTYTLRGTPSGEIEGVVLSRGTRSPVRHANVFVLADVREDPSDPVPADYEAYRALVRPLRADGGILSQMQTDLGLDPVVDGTYGAPMAPGRYFLVAHAKDRGVSNLVPVTVEAGRTVRADFLLPSPGEIEYVVRDEGGLPVPARLSFIALGPDGKALPWDGSNYPELGDARWDGGVVAQEVSALGFGVAKVRPGRYQVIVSRGPEYSLTIIDDFEVVSSERRPLQAVLVHEVDTTGYISADFHVHAQYSVDSGLNVWTRTRSAAAEGLDFFTASDHDTVTSYTPQINEQGMEGVLSFQAGAEVSPLEYGHFQAFPLKYDDRQKTVHNPPPWVGRTLQQVFAGMRERSAGPADAFIIQSNHARDGFLGTFAQIGMLAYDLERKTPGMEVCSAVLEGMPCDFNTSEVLNGKHVEFLHTPTVGEVYMHNKCFEEIKAARDLTPFVVDDGKVGNAICADIQAGPAGVDCDQAASLAAAEGLTEDVQAGRILDRDHCAWHAIFRREVARCQDESLSLLACKRVVIEALKAVTVRYHLERTPEENDAFFATTRATDVGCDYEKAMTGCTAAPDVAGCGGEADCVCEACVCAKLPGCCATVKDGGTGWTAECAAECRNGCHGCEIRPCTDKSQPMEDWFAFLDAGFDKTATANSDSHHLGMEIGDCRNWVKSSTDRSAAVDRDEINRNVRLGKSVIGSGPFIDFELLGDDGGRAGLGEVLDFSGSTRLKARLVVQTASWYGVDRVEIYSNSRLIKRLFIDKPKEEIVDVDTVIDLPTPTADAWYIVEAYGINDEAQMSPAYKRRPYGEMLISTIIGLAANQLLASFGSLLDKLPAGTLDVASLLGGGSELPDSFVQFPFGATNAIRIDIDGKGYKPPKGRYDADGRLLDPPFCTAACTVEADADGHATRGSCGLNQFCLPPEGSPCKATRNADLTITLSGCEAGVTGTCLLPIPAYCPGLQPVGK